MSEIPSRDGTERDARLTALYRAAMREEPPPALDDAIRAAARRAVGSRPHRLSSIRSWRVPLSIAAMMVLTVSLVAVMREEAPEILSPPGGVKSLGEADQTRAGPAADASEHATAAPKILVPRAQRSDGVGLRPPAQIGSSGIGLRDNRVPADPAPVSRNNIASGEAVTRTPAPAPGATAMPELAAGAAAEGKVMSKSEPVSADAAVREPSRARVAASPAAQPSAPPSASQMAGAIQSRADLPPDKWLERIEELRKQGKLEDAKTSLAAFRKRYPAYELPALLKELAGP